MRKMMVWKKKKKNFFFFFFFFFFLYFHIWEVLSHCRECGSRVAFLGGSRMIREGSHVCDSQNVLKETKAIKNYSAPASLFQRGGVPSCPSWLPLWPSIYNCIRFLYIYVSHENLSSGICDQVRHKLACTATEAS